MTVAELVIKVTGDIGGLTRALTEAGVEVKAFAGDAESSNRRASTAFKDTSRSLSTLDRAAKDVRSSFNGGPFNLMGGIGEVTAAILRMGGVVQGGLSDFGLWLQSLDQGATALTGFGAATASAAPIVAYLVTGLGLLGGALVILPALFGAVMFVVQLLADAIGTLSAIVFAALGPLGVLAALLGGLGAGFFLAGQRALQGGGIFKGFASDVEHLTGHFHDLIYTLGGLLLPYFDRLANAAGVAIKYFQQLIHMPLDAAFHSIATKGVRMLGSFLTQVGQVLARPFRLAIQVAFGGGPAQMEIRHLLSQLQGYLFGETINVPIGARAAHGIGASQQVFRPGALQPIMNWFDRHDFTKTGLRWGNELVNGILHSNGAKRIGKWFQAAFSDAGHRAGHSFMAALGWEILDAFPNLLGWIHDRFVQEGGWQKAEMGKAWDWIKAKITGIWHTVTSNVGGEFHTLVGRMSQQWSTFTAGVQRMWHQFSSWLGSSLSTAWDAIKTEAEKIWNEIVAFIERPLAIHISWPSPPSWLSHLPGSGIIGSAFSRLTGNSASGGIFTRPTIRNIGESGAEAVIPLTGGMGRSVLQAMGGGGGGVTVVLQNPTFLSGGRPAARELARVLKPELERIVTAR